ncbi:OmpA family protein [Runella slithyformis]|uniref:OmpA/MotB domain protein n=1 Tax=Runella slithyformis (strain ATCC 29530 / DSM 19594 / LMG 11500 / NCIMB 11436 / LSU 4) TaxID=761193 RepID=A0A7U4E4J9_RUNSL|nr:OmpA family protein [Runella slithyformis]AEI47159.1 OmpA/MotB domain protein [Runella slithyformis DSM 19594]
MRKIILFSLSVLLFASCNKKQLAQLTKDKAELQALLDKNKADCDALSAKLKNDISDLTNQIKMKDGDITNERAKLKAMEDELAYLKRTNTNLLDRLSDLSIVSKDGAESIKKSLDALNRQSSYIQDLNSNLRRKDSLNLALVMNLKRSLDNVSDEDVNVEVKKGVVYISLSDKMLFKYGSYDITTQAENVLSKIAKVVNDRKDFDILVEGHTDSVPYSSASVLEDNWDLSAKRATSVVRALQKKYGVAPERMTAGGRGEYVPKVANDSSQNRSKNRRTEIVILPKLDQFFQLFDAGK